MGGMSTLPTAATDASPTFMRRAWLVVGLLFPVALLNYLDRQMIASMKVSVMGDIKDIGTEANWGHMLASFKWVYAICSPIGGYIADRFSRKLTICGSLFVWSLITWLTGHVSTFNELYIARTAMGISEAFYIPAALALIADYHTGGTRSRAVGVHQMGIYCGVMVGGFAGFAADDPNLGWRFMFDFTGLAGILYAIPLLLLLRDVPRPGTADGSAAAPAAAKPSVFTAVTELLTNRNFILLALYFTLPALAAWVVRDWGPAFLKQGFDISQGKAGVAASVSWQAAALVAAVAGGWLADRWMRRSLRGRIYVSAIGMMLIIPAMFGVGNSVMIDDPQLTQMHLFDLKFRGMSFEFEMSWAFGFALASLVLFGIGWGFFDCNNMPILSQITRPELRATGYGIMNFVSMMCGGVADWGFGAMRDRDVPLNVIFGVFSLICVVSLVIVLAIRPKPAS